MKKIVSILTGVLVLAGCSSTTITEYDKDGNVIKTTQSNDSPIVIGMANTKDKHVLVHIGGYYANLGVQPNANSYGIGAGTLDTTYASIVASDGTKDGAEVAKQFVEIANASKYSLSVSKDGIKSEQANETSDKTSETEKE